VNVVHVRSIDHEARKLKTLVVIRPGEPSHLAVEDAPVHFSDLAERDGDD
jgi:hypothetical protein